MHVCTYTNYRFVFGLSSIYSIKIVNYLDTIIVTKCTQLLIYRVYTILIVHLYT